MPHLAATLIYLSQNYSYYIRGDRSPLKPCPVGLLVKICHSFETAMNDFFYMKIRHKGVGLYSYTIIG